MMDHRLRKWHYVHFKTYRRPLDTKWQNCQHTILLKKFATFSERKKYKIKNVLPDCSDINLTIPQDKPTSNLSFLQTTIQEEVWKITCKSHSKNVHLIKYPHGSSEMLEMNCFQQLNTSFMLHGGQVKTVFFEFRLMICSPHQWKSYGLYHKDRCCAPCSAWFTSYP